jgi:hypothetical protein
MLSEQCVQKGALRRKYMQKRVAAIHDISGFGKCSLTVALPIISAAGVETSVMAMLLFGIVGNGKKLLMD